MRRNYHESCLRAELPNLVEGAEQLNLDDEGAELPNLVDEAEQLNLVDGDAQLLQKYWWW